MAFESFSYVSEDERGFKPLPVGDFRIRVAEAEKMQSKTGKDMLRLVFDVSNSKAKLFHYIVDGEYFNRNISAFFDAFPQIKMGDFNVAGWVGKVGACHTKHEEYNGNINSKVAYFIPASKQGNLPVWVDPENAKEPQNDDGFMKIEDLPDATSLPFA